MVDNKKTFLQIIGVEAKHFEAIGAYFGGFENIATATLNLLNCSEAKIQVKCNLCGFILATIEIKDEKRGNIFLSFGDIEIMEAPTKVHGDLFVKDFTNPIDIVKLNCVLQDEEISPVLLNPDWKFLENISELAEHLQESLCSLSQE